MNISSIRSVTTKPPTTLPVASATAASETMRSQTGCPGIPATMIAPTMTMPWMKFVPDISGVCSIAGTFEITSTPRKAARIRMVSSMMKLVVTRFPAPFWSRTHRP